MERTKPSINNEFYHFLDEKWQSAMDHPVALLRAENATRNPWIGNVIDSNFGRKCTVLDIGCGAGFLTNPLAEKGHSVTGIDLSAPSLEMAKKWDRTASVNYICGSAYELPFQDQSFDVVCAMDLLEHVENPLQVIQEASRVLKPEGLFFFHTFNRNFLSWLVVIKGVEWCVRNTPPNMHVYNLFIKPEELRKMCAQQNLEVMQLSGLRPNYLSGAFWMLVLARKLTSRFKFQWTHSLKTGYVGMARKKKAV